MTALNEDTLVQKTMADYLAEVLGWDSVYAFNTEATRDTVRVAITNYLYDDRTGLPPSYREEEVGVKAQAIFAHILTQQRPADHPM